MIDIQGRPRRSYVVGITHHATGVRLRLDDQRDPEFWAELTVPLAELQRWVRICELAATCPPGFEDLFEELPKKG